MSAGPNEAREGFEVLMGGPKKGSEALDRYNNLVKELTGTYYTTKDNEQIPVNIADILSHVMIESDNFRETKQKGSGKARTIWGLEEASYNKMKDFIYSDGRIREGMGQAFIDAYVERVIRNGSDFIRGRMSKDYAKRLSNKDVKQLGKEYPDFRFKINNDKQLDYTADFPERDKNDRWERYLQCLKHKIPNSFALFRDCWSSGGIGHDEIFMEAQPLLRRLYDSKPGTIDQSALDSLRRIRSNEYKNMSAIDRARFHVDRTKEKRNNLEQIMQIDFSTYNTKTDTTKKSNTTEQPVQERKPSIYDQIGKGLFWLSPLPIFVMNKAFNYFSKNKNSKSQEPTYTNYTIKYGDTFNGIANKYNITPEELQKDNNIADPNKIKEGQVLKIRQSK